ncbi:hypothetical protein U4X54_11605 [Escherichia coli]|nr:hypothetical protein [Escherichia coli]
MKQMTLIEMDGFLKGKCIPRDLKVNETNAEYLVRKFAEIESKLETALRECRSAGITIDNLEAKCAALAADNKKAMEAMRQADAAVKLAHEKFSALTAENAGMKATCEDRRTFIMNGVQLGYIKVPTVDTDPALDTIRVAVSPQESTPATDAFLAEVRAQGVDSAINTVIAMMNHQHPVTSKAIDIMRVHAYQIRKGVQS